MKSPVYLAICLALNVGIATLSQGEDTQPWPATLENLSEEDERVFYALLKKVVVEKKTEKSSTVAPTTITKERTGSKKEKFRLLLEFMSSYLEDHKDTEDMLQAFKEWLESRKETSITLEPTRMETTKKTPTVKPTTEATKGTIGEETSIDEFKKFLEDPTNLKQLKAWLNSKKKSTTAQATTEGYTETEKATTVKPKTTKKPTTVKLTTTKKPTTVKLTTTEKPTTVKPTTVKATTTEKPTTVKPTTTKKPTTVKPTTTKKPTTVKLTTTKKPTTTVKPTTVKATTNKKPTTTVKPTTVEATTNKKPTTTVKPTTVEATTMAEKPSTDQPATKGGNVTEDETTVLPETEDATKEQTEPGSSSAVSTFDLLKWINQGGHFPIFFMVTITLFILLSFAYYNRKKIQKKIKDIKHSKKRGGYVKVKLDDEVELPREANREFVY